MALSTQCPSELKQLERHRQATRWLAFGGFRVVRGSSFSRCHWLILVVGHLLRTGYDRQMSETPFRLVDLEQSEVDMAAVQSAIEAIDAGTYGTCTVCQKDLSEAVKTNPVLLTCEDHFALV